MSAPPERQHPLLSALTLIASVTATATCQSEEPFTAVGHADAIALQEGEFGETTRGRMAIGFQIQHTKGLILDNGDIPGTTTTDTSLMYLALDYRLSDRWSAHAEIPFIRKRSSGGPGAHRPDLLTIPHPEAEFLDDGRYHSAWQDWVLGVSYHTHWGHFAVQSHIIATIPSHDYSHFANAAIGQNLWRLKAGVDFTHRLESSNFYYSAGYSYEIWEKVLGISVNKNHFRASAGYYFSPQVTGWVFANARAGQGLNTNEVGSDRTSEIWYQHDRLSEHNYAIAGIGVSYQFNDHYSLSVTGATMVWGRNVHDLKRAYNLELSRSF